MEETVEIPRPRIPIDIERAVGARWAALSAAGGGGLTVCLPEVDDREDDVLAELGLVPSGDRWLLRTRLPGSRTNLVVDRVSADDVAAVNALRRLAPDWQLAAVLPDAGVRTLVYRRRGRAAAFSAYVLLTDARGRSEAELLGYGVLPEFAQLERAVSGSLLHATLREIAADGAEIAVASVLPELFDRVNLVESAGFRYESATRWYRRRVSA